MTELLQKTLRLWIEDADRRGLNAYLIFDAVWQEELAAQIRSNPSGWEPLMGAFGQHRSEAHLRSPLVVDLAIHSGAIDIWLQTGFPEKLGFVAFSRLPIEGLRGSLKRFMTVITPESPKPVYFRFYDARILFCFLSTGFPEQWRDFFRDIELILAPSDLTDSWSQYAVSGNTLRMGAFTGIDTGFDWRELVNSKMQDDAYRAAYPYRRIAARQYEAIISCSRRGFHNEIRAFLVKAFPNETEEHTTEDLMEFIEAAHQVAEREFYSNEDCVFYWVVLSFMGGLDFFEMEQISSYLQIRHMSRENKLETLIETANKSIDNSHLRDLIDVYVIEERYQNGRSVRYFERSGRKITHGSMT